ncbi:MAG: bifunctional riboflavin kinase/FAD synthetase [Thermodesulfobacteriota bacterium]|nr:bifunctional riboflavin kinase/FAD synthetase [Thermodesulfobacteriota bacterium]
MKLIEDIEKIKEPFTKAVVTIGNFDGVHKGHQALFHQVIEKADELDGTSVVITFDPHPLRALGHNGPPLLTRKDQKMELISESGIDTTLCIPFTKEFASITAQSFIQDFLINKIGTVAIIVGPDYSFGKNREGNIELLKKAGKEMGFEVIVPGWINDTKTGNERISSTRIRDLVMEGRVDETPKYLGRHYQIRGKVIKGRARGGSQLGFPTANIKLHDEICPKTGVYAVRVETNSGIFNGVANIGYSPTFDDHIFTIEVHILDFSEDIYNTRIRVNMIKRLRNEKKFSGIDELSDQIKKDIIRAREIFS